MDINTVFRLADAVADQARTVRIPVHMIEVINRLMRVQKRLMQELGREADADKVIRTLYRRALAIDEKALASPAQHLLSEPWPRSGFQPLALAESH